MSSAQSSMIPKLAAAQATWPTYHSLLLVYVLAHKAAIAAVLIAMLSLFVAIACEFISCLTRFYWAWKDSWLWLDMVEVKPVETFAIWTVLPWIKALASVTS